MAMVDKIPIIRGVVEWVVRFIKDNVAPWIISRGGWVRNITLHFKSKLKLASIFSNEVTQVRLSDHLFCCCSKLNFQEWGRFL